MREMYRLLITNDYMDNEEKVAISNKLMNLMAADVLPVMDGYYLKVYDTEDADKANLELWVRNVDENGVTDHENTHFTKEEILMVMHKAYIKERQQKAGNASTEAVNRINRL